MSGKFIAGVVATALTITTVTANTAQAGNQNDDLGRFIAGATVLAITGLILNDVLDNNSKSSTKTYHYTHKPKVHKPKPKVVQRPRVPRSCLRKSISRNHNYYVNKQCTNAKYRSARPLPQACLQFFRTPQGKRAGYGIGCLKKRGVYLTRH